MAGLLDRLTTLLLVTALLGLAGLGWLLFGGGEATGFRADLAGIGVELSVPEPVRALQREAGAAGLAEAIYTTGEDRLHLRVARGLDPAAGARMAAESEALILGLFEDHQAPYPGALSNTLQCSPELRPQPLEPKAGATFLFSLLANDRYAFGGCADDLLRFHATVGAWYDAAWGELVRIEYFEPRGPEGAVRGPERLLSFRWRARE